MLNPSRFRNILRIDRQRITNAVYLVTFLYLILFSIFNTLYLETLPALKPSQPDHYDLENVAVRNVGCTFPISSYYERTPRYICYLLSVFTIVIRNHSWLATGAAASVLTYSGVAAIHLIILFATNNRWNLPKAKSHCESLPIPGASTSFVACTGVTDPDVNLGMAIVISVMLGALPTAAWSMTFRRSTSKAILIFWLFLLAMGHTFFALTTSNPSRSFQICPKDYIEPLPMANFQAPFLDQSWRDSFSSLVLTAQQSSQSPRNSSSPACIYSCFATAGYLGRNNKDILVWDNVPILVQHTVLKSDTEQRRDSIIFWWVYSLLALLTFFTTEKKGRLPKWAKWAKWVHKRLISIEYRRQPLASRRIWKIVTNIAIKGTKDSISTTDSSEATTSVKIHITVLKVVQLFTQLASVGAFCGCIIVQETQNAQVWSTLSKEPFAAVGQWGNLAVVLLVLVAAGVGRIWADTGAGSAVVGRGKSSLDDDDDDAKNDCWRDGEDEDVETDWHWRIGYAS